MKRVLCALSMILPILGPIGATSRVALVQGQSQEPRLVGRALLGQANDVVVSGTLAYLATSSGLSIADVSDPAKPVERGRLLLPGESLSVAESENQAYLANGREGFFIVNVSDPTRPQVVAHLNSQYAADMAVVGTLGYFADADRLVIFDVSEPDFPIALSSLDLSGFACTVVVNDGLGYVAVGEAGVDLIDVSDPMGPQHLATIATPEDALAVAVRGSVVFVTDGPSLMAFDVSDPLQPKQVAHLGLDGLARDVNIEGNTLYLAGTFEAERSQLLLMDVTDPLAFARLGAATFSGEAVRVTVNRGCAYVAAQCAGMMILNIAEPRSPQLMGTYVEPSCFTDVAALGSTVYVSRLSKDVIILDASDPTNPRPIGSISGPAEHLVRFGDLLVVADAQRVRLFSLADPIAPSQLSRLRLVERQIRTLALSETWLGIGTDQSIILVNISNPRVTTQRRVIRQPAFGLAFNGDLLLAARGTGGLSIIDVSSPTRPRIVSQVPALDQLFGAMAIAAREDSVFLGEWFTGIRIFSLTSVDNPVEVGFYETPASAKMLIRDEKLHVADQFRGLEIVDVADPARPNLISSFNPGGSIISLALEGDRVYLLDSRSGVWILQR